MDDNTKPDEFEAALNEEFGLTATEDQPQPEDVKPPVEDDKPADEPATPPEGEEPKVEEPAPKVEEPPKAEEPQFATKKDVIEAMREYSNETTERVEALNATKSEIIETAYPQGVDKNIYDSNGEVIRTAQDIVDRGLINPRTGEPFEYEQAASWMMSAQQQMNKNVEELEQWAENIAEQNISLIESNKRVMDKWGDVLSSLPADKRNDLAARYISSLTFDKTKSYITNMPMDPETFYDTALAPYKELNSVMAENQRLAEAQKQAEQSAEQNERMGLPPQRGSSKTKANTGDPMLDALMDEMEKE